MKTRLVIVRHGNTFLPGETTTRVGARTDLGLVEKEKGLAAGNYLLNKGVVPDVIYSGPLKRHYQTAELLCQSLGIATSEIKTENFFNEIDYGVDENMPEEDVLLRLGNGDTEKGKDIIDLWNKEAVVPDGWKVNPDELKKGWIRFADKVVAEHLGKTTLLVSSNGTMRFSVVLDNDFEYVNLKVSTGGICIFEKDDSGWKCIQWAVNPS